MKLFAELFFLVLIATFLWGGMACYDEYYGPNLTTEKGKVNIQPFKGDEKNNPIHSNNKEKIDHQNQDGHTSGLPDDDDEDEQLLT